MQFIAPGSLLCTSPASSFNHPVGPGLLASAPQRAPQHLSTVLLLRPGRCHMHHTTLRPGDFEECTTGTPNSPGGSPGSWPYGSAELGLRGSLGLLGWLGWPNGSAQLGRMGWLGMELGWLGLELACDEELPHRCLSLRGSLVFELGLRGSLGFELGLRG